MKRLFQTILLGLLLFGWQSAYAAITSKAPSGSGTSGDPYLIANINNLYWLSQTKTEWNSEHYYKQTADIDASGTSSLDGGKGWTPIGEDGVFAKKFTGHYDGQGYTIDGLTINRPTENTTGLFGEAKGAEIKNIALTNVTVSGKNSTGGLVGSLTNSTTVSNCYVTGSVSSGNDEVGGLVGIINSSSVTECYSTCSVSGASDVGGLIGKNSSGTVTKSFWDKNTSGKTTSAGGTGKTTTQMKTIATFTAAGWSVLYAEGSLTGDWCLDVGGSVNDGYPVSALQYTGEPTNYGKSGAGDSDSNPYLIASFTNLCWIAADNSRWSKHYQQTANIDASLTSGWNSGAGWVPIGNSTTKFTGSYDGDNHTIDGVYINRVSYSDKYMGLFGYIDGATVENLGLTNVDITGYDYVGGLIASAESSSLTNDYVTGSVAGRRIFGGLLGECDNCILSDCYVTCSVNGTGDVVGGLSGYVNGASEISGCYSTGSVTGTSSIGGLIGSFGYSSTMTDCYATGNVTGSSAYVGGLAGFVIDNCSISSCYATGEVTGKSYTGGFVGHNNSSSHISNCYSTGNVSATGERVGGFVGNNNTSTISNSYSAGSVTNTAQYTGGLVGYCNGEVSYSYCLGRVSGTTRVGSLVGYNYRSSSISNAFWNSDTASVDGLSGIGDDAGTTTNTSGKSTEDLKIGCTFLAAGWDFKDETANGSDDNWTINGTDNSGYPALSFQGYSNSIPAICATAPTVGDGSQGSPYEIETFANLYWLSQNSDKWDKHYIQTADIDASATSGLDGGKGFTPIGKNTTTFSGSYDGQGHTIDNLFIKRDTDFGVSGFGLFGYTNGATIKNLGVTNVEITGRTQTGGLIGQANGSSILNSYTTGDISGLTNTGGLIGLLGNSSVNSSVSNSYSEVNVTITAPALCSAGFVGWNESSTISNCYATGSVTGSQYVGGFVGYNSGDVSDSYSIGAITGSSDIGGFIGHNDGGVVSNSFWDTETSGQANSAEGTGKTTAELQTACTYLSAGWDFQDETANGSDDDWTINDTDNGGYPALSFQGYTNTPPICSSAPSGSGTVGDPYLIATAGNLLWISEDAARWDKVYKQTADIDASATNGLDDGAGFTPIGNDATKFTGSYDGDGHTIDGLYINRSINNIGLFGYTDGATIKNLGLTNADITGNQCVGAFVGYHDNSASISECYVAGSISGSYSVGGLIGINDTSTVSNCYAMGSVSAASGANYGGVAAYNLGGSISKCYATNTVSGPSSVGGIVGTSYFGGTGATVTNSFWNSDNIDNASYGIGSPASNDGATGKTTAELQSEATFTGAGWDFSTPIWKIESGKNDGYPFLSWQTQSADTSGGESGEEVTIPAGNTDPKDIAGTGVTIQFTGANSVDLVLKVVKTESRPNIQGTLPGSVQNISPRYWSVEVVSGSVDGTYSITFDLTGVPGIYDCNTIYVLKRPDSSSPWEDVVADLGATIDRSKCPDSITVNGLTAFSEFVLGGEEDNPLPVELTSFSGASTNAGAVLNWKTASEIDNAGFVIYRDGVAIASYTNTSALEGQGTTSNTTSYNYTDSDVYLGESYTYKIVSVDISGTAYEYETTVSVEITEAVTSESETKAYEYALEQNYPNPFNPSTIIRFSLKQAGNTTLRVFDMLGREILSKQFTGNAGWNAYQFNASGLSSGMYYYQISSGSFVETKKMMLLK
ncbi:filamentous haemagglutinin family outer membrane protein [Chloroherpeton thalassium ATCC 35110]|uniref:Filamentous haemagglutinin family outer membrane protein n=1 Tax=Chloroherpeton thalassium (strain ATCC 35110 / GB-78) TaxID=517418 RepID=B3QTX4_CHLT3|nr:T9SS type A sorting domain-containing protein [Chloroherpeton thalassium]ACF14322.1 filamentous haemagglutinin family outer membrane protein [Chloroherpeton thalassium ATCC 35110]